MYVEINCAEFISKMFVKLILFLRRKDIYEADVGCELDVVVDEAVV